MTTVVSNLECMAADQRTTGGGPMFHTNKLYRVGDSIFGIAGDCVLGHLMMDWLATKKRDRVELYELLPEAGRNEIEILELSPDGLAYWNGWGVRLPLLDHSYAIGSGAMAALQALRLGQEPEDAVMEAAHVDESTGIFIAPQVEYLKPPKRKRG